MSVNVSNCLLICSKTRAIFQMQHPSLNRKTETEFKKCQQWTRFIDLKQLLFLPFLKWHVRLWFSTNFQNSSITLLWRGRERERERERDRVLASTFEVVKANLDLSLKLLLTFFTLNLLIYAFLITFVMTLTYLWTGDVLLRGREDRCD